MTINESLEYYRSRIATLDQSIAKIEEDLADVKAMRKAIIEDELVSFMAENGLSLARFSDGTTAEVKRTYNVKTLSRFELVEWFKTEGLGALVTESIDFAKGEADDALYEFLSKEGYAYARDVAVHPQTLKKAIKDRIEEGLSVPPESVAEVSVYDYVDIKTPKKSIGE